jgi:hypothetical protein
MVVVELTVIGIVFHLKHTWHLPFSWDFLPSVEDTLANYFSFPTSRNGL